MELTSPSAVRDLMQRHKFKCRKSLGQNFLADANIIEKILRAADLHPQDAVIEIGPGLGTLTRRIAAGAGKVLAVEVDKCLLPILAETLEGCGNAEVFPGDALKLNFDELARGHFPSAGGYKIIANLPYYVTTPILMHILESKFNFTLAVVMVQEEVARRMVSPPGAGDYGALSVAIQYYTRPEPVCKVSRNVFIPRPEVGSAVVKLVRRETAPVDPGDQAVFFSIVRAAFGQRRKTIINALAGAPLGHSKEEWHEIITGAGINPSARGETLGLEEFAALARCYYERSGNNCTL